MRRCRLAVSVFVALCALLLLVSLANRAGADPAAAGVLSVEELALHPSGGAYEVNIDPQGMAWVSDYDAGEIWQIDPSTDVYTSYHGLTTASDARGDGTGAVWWAEGSSNRLGRLQLASGEATFWEMPGAWALYGTHIDAAGMIWTVDFGEPNLYRLDPSTNQVCVYTLPDGGATSYLTGHTGEVWVGDWDNNRVYRLDVVPAMATYWQAPYDILPEKVVRDGQGRLWWADDTLDALALLDPAASTLTRYDPPVSSSPAYAAVSEVGIWYTDWADRVGLMQPRDAAGVVADVLSDTVPITPTCEIHSPSASAIVTHTVGAASWSTVSYGAATETGGWWAYDLPEGGIPWGIDVGQGYAWFVDTNRYVVGRISLDPWSAHRIYLPLVLRQ